MKRSAAASPGVSLFPFLAILLCTMGALIVVLVVINRQAHRQTTSRDADAVAARRTMELDHEELELQLKQLTAARQATLDELDKARRHLSGLEDQSRQLNDQLSRLKDSARLLAADRRFQQREAMRAELARLHARRVELDEQIAQAQKAANQKPSFAIIPYDGLYHTDRRPIYIECRGDAVILQPEGIVFTPHDFLGPPGPGNPLASALRAAREYWSSVPPAAQGLSTEPYPLLLVRPDGIIAYYLVRDAMSSWASEFGYELVDEDWKLEFPTPPDPQLVQMETRAVDEARERLKWLAQVSPEVFVRKSNAQFRVSSAKGGLVRDGGPLLGHDPFADDPLGGFGRKGNSATPSHSANTGPGYGAGNAHGLENGSYPAGNRANAGDNATGSNGGEMHHASTAGTSITGYRGGPTQESLSSAGRSGDAPFGSPRNDSYGSTGAAGSSAQAGNPMGQGSSPGQAGDSPGQGSAADPSSIPGMPSPNLNVQAPQRTADRAMADSRGRDWALPNRESASVPITRPIRVECRADRLVLIPDVRDQQAQVIPLSDRTGETVDQLVAAVRAHTQTWGMAGRGMYWKPQLILEVDPTAEGRAADLQVLLANSGLEVKRK